MPGAPYTRYCHSGYLLPARVFSQEPFLQRNGNGPPYTRYCRTGGSLPDLVFDENLPHGSKDTIISKNYKKGAHSYG